LQMNASASDYSNTTVGITTRLHRHVGNFFGLNSDIHANGQLRWHTTVQKSAES
jgi:hypothetical protein